MLSLQDRAASDIALLMHNSYTKIRREMRHSEATSLSLSICNSLCVSQ